MSGGGTNAAATPATAPSKSKSPLSQQQNASATPPIKSESGTPSIGGGVHQTIEEGEEPPHGRVLPA